MVRITLKGPQLYAAFFGHDINFLEFDSAAKLYQLYSLQVCAIPKGRWTMPHVGTLHLGVAVAIFLLV